jgi:hypothetical protein
MEHPLDVAGHDPWTFGRVTLWSGPGPEIMMVPIRPAGVTQLPTDDDDVAVSVKAYVPVIVPHASLFGEEQENVDMDRTRASANVFMIDLAMTTRPTRERKMKPLSCRPRPWT